jgi:branched-subunit amino acid transport protein
MTSTWLLVAGVAGVCLTMRVASPLLLGSRSSPTLTRALEHSVPALLAALVITQTFAQGRRLTVDARLAGVIAGAAVALARKPVVLVLLAAAGTTALLRAVG